MSERIYDVNGWYEVPRNPISRAGVFPYTAKSIGAPNWQEDPNRIVNVYRPEDELSSDETMQSARLVPWIDDHTMLGDPDLEPGLTAPEDVGVQGTTGEAIEYDPASRTLFANIKMFGRQLRQKIDAGKKELSMGFRCVYEHGNGSFEGQPYEAIQRNIRFNHKASVDAGRMGSSVAVMDGIERFAFDESEVREIKMKPTVRAKLAALMGVSVVALDAAIADPAKFKVALDAEAKEEAPAEGGSGDVTLAQAAEQIKEIAEPLGELNAALAEMATGMAPAAADPGTDPDAMDDDMEPVLDAGGNQIMEGGKPKMQKKAAAVDATAPAIAAMDAAVKILKTRRAAIKTGDCTALDAEIKKAEDTMAKVKTIHAARSVRRVPGGDAALALRVAKLEAVPAMDAAAVLRSAMKEVGARDVLAKSLSNFVGAFDASEMTLAQVGEYGNEKLKLNAPKGQELGAVQGYISARTTAAPTEHAADAAVPATGRVAEYLNGTAAA